MKNKKQFIHGGVAAIITGAILYLLLPQGYGFIGEFQNRRIDIHNFKQLEKIQLTLAEEDPGSFRFFGIDEFNRKYNQDLEARKNCLYISSENGSEKYIVGFKLESKTYRGKYGVENYSYPKYDIPPKEVCVDPVCYDSRKRGFEYIISHICE